MLDAGRKEEIVREAEKIQGWMSRVELEWLASAASEHSHIVEVGSWKGRSTKALGMATAGVVYAVDHWKGSENERGEKQAEAADIDVYEIFEKNLKPEIDSGKVVPVYSDSADAILSLKRLFAGKVPDMVFIDSDHQYDSVRRDIGNYLGLLGKGGLISGHDYSVYWPDVRRAVDKAFPDRQVVEGGAIWFTTANQLP